MPPDTPYEDPTDPENAVNVGLMLRVKKGDHAAFEKLVELHQNAVIGTVAKMLGSNMDAEDIAQQVFIRLWKSAAKYEVKAKFTTFLYTITKNLVFNESRRRKGRKEQSLEEKEEISYKKIEDQSQTSPSQEMLKAEMQSQVDKAIAQLPEKQRLAVVLRRYEDMPYEEIADVLELSVSAVKSQLFRARTTLKELLTEYL